MTAFTTYYTVIAFIGLMLVIVLCALAPSPKSRRNPMDHDQ